MFRRTTVVPWAIFIFVAVMTVIGIKLYANHPEFTSLNAIDKIRNQPSALYARLLIHYDSPPIYEEEYDMSDVEGESTFSYRVRSYAGRQVKIYVPKHAMTDVSFFFGKLVQDGVWDLMDKAPAGNTAVHYTVYVKQLADFKQGDRTVTFTDPHYWATTAGRQFTIDLRKDNPNDLLKMKSTQLADPRYQTIVDDFRTFGPPAFRAKIASVRASLARSAAAK
ncbi:MAG TPA: hypothetical protein VMA98_03090 [Candidatus Acidoferrales bacterium]|nr:hypothetical protein [Candidatus Acidoferrales bacterium]